MPEDMSPYCSVHDEWLIMKRCMYVGYHDANNVVTQLNVKTFNLHFYTALRTRSSMAVSRSPFLRLLLRDRAQTESVWKTVIVNILTKFASPIVADFSMLSTAI